MHTAHSFNLWRTIDRLHSDHSIDRQLILNGTSLKRGSELSALELMQISQNLKTDSKNLLNADLDLETLAQHLRGNTLFIPKKYSKGMFSSSTSLKNTVNQFKRFGMKNHILKRLQVNESYLDEHRPLSVLAVKDALDEVHSFLTDEDLKNYSRANAIDFYNSEFGRIVKIQMTKSNLIETIINEVHNVERNWHYKIISQDSLGNFRIQSQQSEQMNELNSGVLFTTPKMNKMRAYFFDYFIGLCGFTHHKVAIESQSFSYNNSNLILSINI